jgi:hypothetical protein
MIADLKANSAWQKTRRRGSIPFTSRGSSVAACGITKSRPMYQSVECGMPASRQTSIDREGAAADRDHRPTVAILEMKDLGDNVVLGG